MSMCWEIGLFQQHDEKMMMLPGGYLVWDKLVVAWEMGKGRT